MAIGVIVGVILFACCFAWILENISFSTMIIFLLSTWLLIAIFCIVRELFITMYKSCKESNQKKTTTNVNKTVRNTTPSQSKIEPVT